MKNKKILVILSLIIVAVLILGIIFSIAIYRADITNFDTDTDFKEFIIGKEIVEPDRMVYRDLEGNYFEFTKETEKYRKMKALLENSITNYNKNGKSIANEIIDEIHSKSFIEFDYKTASKNYIIQLEDNDNEAVIKLSQTGGNVVTENIKNLSKIKKTLKTLVKNERAYSLAYKEVYSRNPLQSIEYKYQELFKITNKFNIYQAKIENMEDFEKFKQICNFAIEEKITEETFNDNVIILTVTSLPKIDVKVNIGNIKYYYDTIENSIYQYTVHLLIVNKIVNTDCIYNTDFTEIESKVAYDNMKVEYNDSVDNLSSDVFVTDFENFIKEYNLASSSIPEEEAAKIAEKGFKEAERICGSYPSSTQKAREEKVKPNNFFTRKMTEYDNVYQEIVEAYVFTRIDDMGINGVEVFVDKRTGRIIGGEAFGD